MNYKIAFIASVMAMVVLTGCDESTGSLGIADDADLIQSTESAFEVRSKSMLLDSVVANSNKCYLGEVLDVETGTIVRAEFLTQFYTTENYVLPADSLIIKNEQGELEADSVDVRLYYTNYYGIQNNPMKIQVFELDRENVLREDLTYYSDINLESFLPENAQPLATKTFTSSDYTLPEAERISSEHYDNVRVRLPKAFGTKLLRTAREHPEWFINSWQFTHHVCSGFYFKLLSGVGTMLELDVSALNVYFRYHDAKKDTVYQAISRFSATVEVIQSSRIQNTDLTPLLDESKPYTYLKSPAGIATELTLPVDEVFQGHDRDSVNRARLILTRLNALSTSDFTLPMPQSLLLVRKQNLYSFFSNREVTDGRNSYTTSFDSNYNTYTFGNISLLLSQLHREKQAGMAREGEEYL